MQDSRKESCEGEAEARRRAVSDASGHASRHLTADSRRSSVHEYVAVMEDPVRALDQVMPRALCIFALRDPQTAEPQLSVPDHRIIAHLAQ